MNTKALERLRAFRQEMYTPFGCRRDALVEILAALLTSPVIEHPAYLSLAPGFQRRWGSIYAALNAGTMSLPRLEHLVATQPLETTTAWYAIDASVWPRCDAETSPERGYYHHHTRQSHGQPIVAGWNYSWLVQLPERCSSWTAPLRVRRMQPGANVNQVAAEQIRSFLRQRGTGKPRPVFTFDAGYDPVQLGMALAGLDVGALVRLRSGRCFYADPPPGPTGGRPRRHGTKLVCDDPTTWPRPTAEWSTSDAEYGRVQIQCWSGLHVIPHNHEKRGTRQARPIVRGTLIRLEVERLPKLTKVPVPRLSLVVGARTAGSGDHLADLCRAVLHRTHLSLLQTGAQMDDAQTALTGSRRSLDLVSDPGLCPTPPSAVSRQRSSSALASGASDGEADAGARASGLFATSANPGPSGIRAKTLWTLARTPERAAIETREAVPGDQIDGVISSKTALGALFTDFFMNAGPLLLVKWQA